MILSDSDFWNDAWHFVTHTDWMRVFFTIVFTVVAVVAGIWFPARMLEQHTNQPLAKPVWYVIGTLALVMVYICMYSYGHFWELYGDSPELQQAAPPSQ